MENNEIKECPFCGGEAKLKFDDEPCYHGSAGAYYVQCKKCKASIENWSFKNKESAIAAWNGRAR